MAVRLNLRHSTIARERIRVGMIINRLHKCVAGEIEMTPAQVQSAKLLLDKSLSNAPEIKEISGKMDIQWPLPKSPLDV